MIVNFFLGVLEHIRAMVSASMAFVFTISTHVQLRTLRVVCR